MISFWKMEKPRSHRHLPRCLGACIASGLPRLPLIDAVGRGVRHWARLWFVMFFCRKTGHRSYQRNDHF